MWLTNQVANALQDVRLAARSLGRTPGFVVAAALSLALGIGAGVAGFTVLDAIRFRALPFPHADRLVLISEKPKGGCKDPNACWVDYRTFQLLRDHEHELRSVDALSGFSDGPKSLGTGENQIDIWISQISNTLLPMLDVKPELGRNFTADEDRIGGPRLMIIGHDLWQNVYGGDPHILGKTVVLSDEPFTIIGVLPHGFNFESHSEAFLAASRYLDPSTGTSRRWSYVLARLAPGATIPQLRGELSTLEAAGNAVRSTELPATFAVDPLRSRYVTSGDSHDLVFAAIVGAILLIACANVASLVLVRATKHRRELAIRAALGAGARRLAGYVFLQNLLLAALGLAAGLGLASTSLRVLRAVAPLPPTRFAGLDYHVDLRAVLFATVLALVAAVILSLAPIRLLSQSDLQETLREGALATTSSRRTHRMHAAFVVVQSACAVALLVASALMSRTVLRFDRLALGYDADRVVQVQPVPAHAGRVPERYLPLDNRLLQEFLSVNGVERTAQRASVRLAFAKPGETPQVLLDGDRLLPPGALPTTAFGVTPDYFATLGIPVVSGRAFALTDSAASPQVAIINQWAARRWWPGENAVGKRFDVDTALGMRATVTVVGVVRDNMAAQPSVLLAKPGPEVYRPWPQAHYWVSWFFARARVPSPPARMLDAMQRIVMSEVPNGRPAGSTMVSQAADQINTVRMNALQIAGFSAVGLLLAITGLYGVLSYVVQQRTQEIGIRGVLGATQPRILGMMMSQALELALLGVVIGLAASVPVMGVLQGLLYGTPVVDPLVYAGVAAVFLVVALAAGFVPAYRASRVDPAVALRG